SPELTRIAEPVSSQYEAAGIIAALDGKPVLFENVDEGRRVLSGFCAGREQIAAAMGLSPRDLLLLMARAMAAPVDPPLVTTAPCQEVTEEPPDLGRLPILRHLSGDGGPYITAGVAVIHDPEYGRNACYHRAMVVGPRECAVRVVQGRGTDTAWRRGDDDVPMAFAIGCPLPVLIAAAMSPAKGVDELAIANAIAPTPLVRCRTVPLEVPAEAEYVIEGRLTHRLAAEGPFIDLTETWDFVREQPVFEVDCITHRRDPIYHAILPGLSEHKTIMGLPRVPGIFNAVAAVCDVEDVMLSPGGMGWLHARVKLHRRTRDDAALAIRATMEAHPSVKMVIAVDDDIDIYDDTRVEWAIATRVQAGADLYIYRGQPSSSLDPSAKHPKGERPITDKLGIDATIPWPKDATPEQAEAAAAAFRRVSYPPVDLGHYLHE
ncbi:MAG: UbiD family decarboxylase, partial [Anaerolineae bacterium]